MEDLQQNYYIIKKLYIKRRLLCHHSVVFMPLSEVIENIVHNYIIKKRYLIIYQINKLGLDQ